MDNWQRVVNIAAVLAVLSIFVTERQLLKYFLSVVRKFRFRMFLEVLCLLVITGTIGLMLTQLPILSFGWANVVLGKDVNIAVLPISNMTQSPQMTAWIWGTVFYVLFLVVLPHVSRLEEDLFRKGKNNWTAIGKWSVLFGLVHCLMGIPLGAGIALVLPGLFFGMKYKQAFDRFRHAMTQDEAEEKAMQVSTVYHTLYNVIVVSGFFFSSVLLRILT